MSRAWLSILLVPAVAVAMPPPQPGDPPVEPPPQADPRGIAAARAPAPEHELLVRCEPLGRGDDRTARRLEELLRGVGDALSACRARAIADGADPIRFQQIHAKLKVDGSFRRLRTTSSTGDATVDACVASVVGAVVFDPPPMFNDNLEVNVTWKIPSPPAKDE